MTVDIKLRRGWFFEKNGLWYPADNQDRKRSDIFGIFLRIDAAWVGPYALDDAFERIACELSEAHKLM